MSRVKITKHWFSSILALASTVALFIVLLLVFSSFAGRLPLQIPIRPFLVLSGCMKPNIGEGSVVFVKQDIEKISIGDVVTFKRPGKPWENVTHRVVGEQVTNGQTMYRVKGDANKSEDLWLVPKEAILGKVVFNLPAVGYVLSFSKTKPGIILFYLLPLLVMALDEIFLVISRMKRTHKRSGKKKIALLVTMLIMLLVSPSRVKAADLQITCSGLSSCAKAGLDPLFSDLSDGVWYPGKCVVRTLGLKNASSQAQQIVIQKRRSSSVSSLENIMHVGIYKVGSSQVSWSGNLVDFYSADNIELGVFESQVSRDYNFSLCMDSVADNDYQNLQSVFDLMVGLWGEVVTPTPPSGGAGGVSFSFGASAPSCDDKRPGSAPVLISATSIGGNRVLLKWSKARDPVTYYLVAYGTKSGVLQYGNPNVGGSETTSYVVGGLSGGQVYYFRVRAGNGCMPGDYSNEVLVSVPGKSLESPAAGFLPGVLGTETPLSVTATPTQETETLAPFSRPWVGPLVLALLVFLLGGVLYWRFFRKQR